MNKAELVNDVAERMSDSKMKAEEAVNAVFDAISQALKRGDEVRLVGFGTFTVSRRKASEGRNPRTGEPIQIPETKNPKFRAGKTLKQAVNG